MTSISHIQSQIGTEPDGKWGDKSKQALKSALAKGVKITVTANISLNELLHSDRARQHGIDNIPDHAELANLIAGAVNLWQPVRDILGVPIKINSGYRNERVNDLVGGVSNSAHKYGLAIDFVAPQWGLPKDIVPYIVRELNKRGIKFDQAISEHPNGNPWVHLGYKSRHGAQRGQQFTIYKKR